MKSNKKIIFVVPWYGENATGGAETLCRTVAEHLANYGQQVEIFTTTSKQFQSNWENDLSAGAHKENGMMIRRFKVNDRDRNLFNYINGKILSSTLISDEQEAEFFKNNINSNDMMKAIKDDSDSLFVFIPYLYGTTFFGCQIHPEKSIMIPCLHDEGYARLKLMKKVMSQVRAIAFNSKAEKN